MDVQDVIDLSREAMLTALLVGAPVLLMGAAVGLAIGLIQALTQIQDQTISFVPKIIAMMVVLGFCLPWLIQKMVEYSEDVFLNIPQMLAGG